MSIAGIIDPAILANFTGVTIDELKELSRGIIPKSDFKEIKPQAENITENIKDIPQQTEQTKRLNNCTFNDFKDVIISSYGMGIMDTFYERDSPSWLQVWFTAEEVTEKVKEKGYFLTVDKAKFFLDTLLRDKRKLLEARSDLIRGLEYRRVRLSHISFPEFY